MARKTFSSSAIFTAAAAFFSGQPSPPSSTMATFIVRPAMPPVSLMWRVNASIAFLGSPVVAPPSMAERVPASPQAATL